LGLIYSLLRQRIQDSVTIQFAVHHISISKVVIQARGGSSYLLTTEKQALLKALPSSLPRAAVTAFVRWIYCGELPFGPSVDPIDVLDSSDFKEINSQQKYMDYLRQLTVCSSLIG